MNGWNWLGTARASLPGHFHTRTEAFGCADSNFSTWRHRQNADFVVQLLRLYHFECGRSVRPPNRINQSSSPKSDLRRTSYRSIECAAICSSGRCLRNTDKPDNDRHESPRDNQPLNSRDSLTINICVSLRSDFGKETASQHRRETIATANKVKCLFKRCHNEPESDSGTV